MFLLIRGVKFWTIVWKLALVAIISMIAPSLWYIAAYNQGGENFWALVYEENVGRLTGTMTYASHEGPAIINFVYLISG
ncbi:MAG: dolichyl-phosphate-mannose--protein mannosyltransferase, partial [Paludibacteraceae bacterium]|nr:dolichyl-phosphate-mannose--protein mannosyltransferase [Paludibacteraceae bacterium]